MEQVTEPAPGISLEVVEALFSRLCHDLAGPIGAIHNGLEIIEESQTDPSPSDDLTAQAITLLGHSANQAARRLRLFRLAYGQSTRDGVRNFNEIREAVGQWLEGRRVELAWPDNQPPHTLSPRPGLAKVLTNLVVLAIDSLPKGGIVAVEGAGETTSGWCSITARGRMINGSPALAQILAGGAPTLQGPSPQAVHAVLTARFAARDGLKLVCDQEGDALIFQIRW